MGDTPESGVSPKTGSPRSLSPLNKGDGRSDRLKDTSRHFSPLRQGQNTSAFAELPNERTVTSTANGAPTISKSGPTSEPLSAQEPGEFPFHVVPSEVAGGEQAAKVPPRSPGSNGPMGSQSQQPQPISRRPTGEGDESDAPKGRRSVQFARSATFDMAPAAHSRNQSWEADDENNKGKEREKQGSSLMTKLKALAAPIGLQGHGRSLSAFAGNAPTIHEGSPNDHLSPSSERDEYRFEGQDSEADADAEESAGEGPSRPPRTRRKSRRWFDDGTQTAPTTPKNAANGSLSFSFSKDSPGATPTSTRPGFLRRGTMSDIPENQRQGMSEDEGRDRLAKESAWTRGLHSARGLSYGGLRRHDRDAEDSEERRPSHLRRLTAFGGGAGADGQPSPWRIRGERTSSLSAQKWRSLKASLRMIGSSKKAERQVDHVKSAELMAELLSGAPAALFLASMFQRDEHGRRRIPILLEQLKIHVTDSHGGAEDKKSDRHHTFRVELEYGSGLTRMKWVIYRSIRDFARLHYKYRLQHETEKFTSMGALKSKPDKGKARTRHSAMDKGKQQQVEKDSEKVAEPDKGKEPGQDKVREKGPKLPSFPFPIRAYLNGLPGIKDLLDEEEPEEGAASGLDGDASGTDRPPRGKRRVSSFHLSRSKSNIGANEQDSAALQIAKQSQTEHQRKLLEKYLISMIAYFIFRPDSNRLSKFLELSALGVRLAAEGGYHGKEGYLAIGSTKGVDNRKNWISSLIGKTGSLKWFLVRHSYIVCVDSPEEMNVYDVFLVDSDFAIETRSQIFREKKPASEEKQSTRTKAKATAKATATRHHQLRLKNSERKIKLTADKERIFHQFEESIRFMKQSTPWASVQRFGSFAPVRKKIYAQWLVDGRDYMWNVSRAISMARDVIYIHDWWLSPELYMRRPAAISQKWRLDRLLQRKAQEGVKVFVIIYRNINTAIPIDSEYSKFSLLDLHPNVFVQRSPNQIRQNTFFWAHHEKICIVDHTIAFCGGVDLCFGRWDTPQHSVVDDKSTGFELDDTPKDADHCQLWPGKDYSNPRVMDFFDLHKPYEEMYSRSKVPRMPWHDIGMQIVGQPARDLTRHFVQRWNYLLRQRKPSRPTPFLLPPPDFNPADIEALGLDGTCEVQILRSATSWSLGTPNKTEHSIMNAYVQMISTSEHFVYIENQFYISSCEVLGTKIENRISDALVDRIKRAHQNQEDWRACIIIPLMPGFQNTVDQQDGSSVRLIMTCQYRSICRGETSIFGRLRAAGIEPEDYIQFYALRSWGQIGPNKGLVTEQLYIHAKCMVVDDRVAIIGSANINERSMLGSRDSEIAAVVRDTEMLDSHMGGEPYKVGKFPHTLRVRLMREHLGVDVDGIMEDECQSQQSDMASANFHTESSSPPSPSADQFTEQKLTDNKHRLQDDLIARAEKLHSFNHDIDWEQANNPHLQANKKPTTDSRIIDNAAHEKDVRGEGADHMKEMETRPSVSHGRDSYVNEKGQEVLLSDIAAEGLTSTPKKSSQKKGRGRSNTTGTRTSGYSGPTEGYAGLPPPKIPRMDTQQLGLTLLSQLPALPSADDTDIGGPPLSRTFSYASSLIVNPLLAEMRRPVVTDDCMRDPLNDSFYLDTWHTVAENNTKLFRHVFRCQPDNEVRTWKDYKEYAAFAERFSQSQGLGKAQTRKQEAPGKSGPPGQSTADKITSLAGNTKSQVEAFGEKLSEKIAPDHSNSDQVQQSKMGKVEQWAEEQEKRTSAATLQHVSSVNTVLDEKHGLEPADDAVVSPIGPTPSTNQLSFPPPPAIPDDTANVDFATTSGGGVNRARTVTITEPPKTGRAHANTQSTGTGGSRKGRRRATTKSSTRAFHATDDNVLLDKDAAKQLLELVQGHLVVWPYDWLEREEESGGWLYTVDQIAPLEI